MEMQVVSYVVDKRIEKMIKEKECLIKEIVELEVSGKLDEVKVLKEKLTEVKRKLMCALCIA